MASSYSASLRATLQATGENTNTWGSIGNTGGWSLLDDAIAGITTSATATLTLSTANGSTDQARKAILNYTGSTAGVWTIPSVSKVYQVRTATAQLTLTNGSSSLIIVAGDLATVATDGTSIWKIQSADLAGRKLTNLGAPTSDLDASTKKYVDDTAFSAAGGTLPGQTGNGGKVIWTDGTLAYWALAVPDFITKTTTYTAVAGDRIFADTSGGAFTITLPASPVEGDEIFIADGGITPTSAGWSGNALTIARNGSTLGGVAENMTCQTRGGSFRLTYTSSNWKVTG